MPEYSQMPIKEDLSLTITYSKAVNTIKEAILNAQYEAARGVNSIQLMLYYGIGRYLSHNTRQGKWGTDAIGTISRMLKADMPGLRGYSESNLKRMRTFYEEWRDLDADGVDTISPIKTDDLASDNNSPIKTGEVHPAESTSINILSFNFPAIDAFPANDFRCIGFTHHSEILAKCKSREERLFYISICAREHLTPDGVKNCIKQDLYAQRGQLPNNFLQRLPSGNLAKRAILAFKDQYMLDFINVEELGARDIEEVNETLVEQTIVNNIKQFILRMGKDFLFMGNQYTVTVGGHDHRIDLLFFNRELDCLVAIELKTGPFKSIYLGELNGYLRLLDDYVRKPHENPSIGIILCKSAERSYVEYMIQDYDKPMGVATYKTATDMPERLRKALPNQEELLRLMSGE